MMIRQIEKLQHGSFDVLVIGGGIYGSWIACHCAFAGLTVAIIDQGDWASGTSSSSSKLLHGGLRYLERFEFGMVRKSLHERRELSRRMPHHVQPLEFVVPVFRHSRIGRWRLKAGLWLYDFLAGRDQPVPRHRYLNQKNCAATCPDLNANGLLGGFSYGDCGTDDGRMVFEIIESAQLAGAVACNYVCATELLMSQDRVVGARLRDEESGQTFECGAKLVINAAGPWIDRLQHHGSQTSARIRLTKGIHLVMPTLQSPQAMLLTAQSDGRVFFLIPWYGRTLLGTTDTNYHGDPADVAVSAADIEYLLSAANNHLTCGWTTDDIQAAYVGLRTLQDDEGAAASSVSREWLLDDQQPGLLTSIGGKYTSARVDGLAVADRTFRLLQHKPQYQNDSAMAWYPGDHFSEWQQKFCQQAQAVGIDAETARHCSRRYGSRSDHIIEITRRNSSLAERIVPELPFCRAEVVHCVQHEMPRTLCDVLRRRIPLMLLTQLHRNTVTEVCQLTAEILDWDAERQQCEIDSVLQTASAWLLHATKATADPL